MMRTIVVLLAALLCAPPGAADERRAFVIEDLYRLKGVSDPRVSPDGARIAFVVQTSDLPRAKRTSRIWVVGADGSDPRPLTSGEKSDSAPRWSPDGKTLAFVSTRSGSPQVWLLPASGGEATRLTDLSTGVSDPVWTPDGKAVLLVSEVHPGCGADDGCNKKRDERREKGPLKVQVADRLLYRHWSGWKEGKRSHILLIDVQTKKARDLTPGDFDAPVFQLGGPPGFDVSPDGQELCYASNHDPDEARSTNSDLWVVPVGGGEARNITASNPAWDGSPRYSPDGRFIAFRMQATPGYESDRFRLALHDRREGTIRPVSDHFDSWVEDFEWFPDSRRIAFTTPWRGKVPLFVLDVETASVRQAADLGTIDAFDLSPDGGWVALSRRKVGNPSEVFRFSFQGGEARRLTFENEAIEKEVDIRPAEIIEVPGAGGRPVQVFLVKPHGFDSNRKYPLILNVHGGPQSQWADSFRGDWQVYPGAGYIVAFPNPHGSTGFGQEYTAAISRDWAGKVMEDIGRVADALADLPYVDGGRMGAMGWSWGGYAMMWLEGQEHRFRCLAAMMGVYNLTSMYGATEELWFPEWDLGGKPWESDLYARHSPSSRVRRFKTPCLVITGEKDYRVPYTQSLEFFTALQVMGVPSRLIVLEKAGHWPSWVEMALYYNAHLEWFQKHLGGGGAPWDTEEMARNGPPFKVE